MEKFDGMRAQAAKEQGKSYLNNRQAESKMPPSLEEIRRQLGWHLCDVARGKSR